MSQIYSDNRDIKSDVDLDIYIKVNLYLFKSWIYVYLHTDLYIYQQPVIFLTHKIHMSICIFHQESAQLLK